MTLDLAARGRLRGLGAGIAILLVVTPCDTAIAQPEMPPIPTPFPTPDFHFSDPARDREYWRLQREKERTLAVFRESVFAAYRALPSQPPQPGSPVWLQARTAIEQAIRDRRPARDAIMTLTAFVTREGRQVSPAEAQYALDVRHADDETLRGTVESLVNLLALLAGIRTGQWPA